MNKSLETYFYLAHSVYRRKEESLGNVFPAIFIHIFVMGSERRIFSAIKCISGVQGHLMSLILAPIERAYATFY